MNHIDAHNLVLDSMTNSMLQILKIPNFKDLNHDELDGKLGQALEKCLRYDYGVMQWSLYVSEVLYRLQELIDMSTRRICKRKNEKKSSLLKQWLLYNYEFYSLTYQSGVNP